MSPPAVENAWARLGHYQASVFTIAWTMRPIHQHCFTRASSETTDVCGLMASNWSFAFSKGVEQPIFKLTARSLNKVKTGFCLYSIQECVFTCYIQVYGKRLIIEDREKGGGSRPINYSETGGLSSLTSLNWLFVKSPFNVSEKVTKCDFFFWLKTQRNQQDTDNLRTKYSHFQSLEDWTLAVLCAKNVSSIKLSINNIISPRC